MNHAGSKSQIQFPPLAIDLWASRQGVVAETPAGRPAATLPCQRVTTQPDENLLPQRLLRGSQAKTAFALRLNAEQMIAARGLNHCGFLTLTVGDYVCASHGKQIPKGKHSHCPLCQNKMLFRQVFDFDEASRRINSLASHQLHKIFRQVILVLERHQSGAIHFHALAGLQMDADIRTGFDFEAVKRRDYFSVCPELKALWASLREMLPRYGFGRAELTPIRKTAEAVASYVSKYIEKNICQRPASDKGRRLVRYLGWNKRQLKPNEFEWNTRGANNWRNKVRHCLRLAGVRVWERNDDDADSQILEFCDHAENRIRPKICDWSNAARKFGSRWAHSITGIMREVWGDECEQLIFNGSTVLRAIDLLEQAKRRYEKTLLEGFRWAKGLSFDLICSDDADQARRDWWQLEFETEGLKLEQDFFDSLPAHQSKLPVTVI